MNEKIQKIQQDIQGFIFESEERIETFRIKYLSKKGEISVLFKEFKTLPSWGKKQLGTRLNDLKNQAQSKVQQAKISFSRQIKNREDFEDLTKPGMPFTIGARHPVSVVKNRIVKIFRNIGFITAEGPEIEDDWHNFTALNLPTYHPARDMQDTFFIEQNPDILLRTHTSSVQIRYMKSHQPPIRILSPGRVYRNEAISARSHCMFHQIEGLYVDKQVSFADLKQTLQYFTTTLFGKSRLRLRPSYFPFTEPSAEVDVYWGLETEIDQRITKGTGWLEIMGCGMVDPQVLRNTGIDNEEFSGFAFGMGIERIALLLYQIGDIRSYFENDLRFLKQFEGAL
ncbi:phenylalanine--tRNA ligase subunit alpha [Bacteroidetes bacterium endosymbiont of Geopemphigus sp.]|uniref:phenylalanine--tRNA ligase subunit alpha n=1 Tax=Bacteroidetes bacterium endosymbiont of Geopemphigus sp. TaxID=2047937 RepID=UPI000CD0DFFF|nr:phenylalanine--tRNA ligase subunit alpha [Bacteroidetes bacterium endosymbiont of Geopemphigus sp.]